MIAPSKIDKALADNVLAAPRAGKTKGAVVAKATGCARATTLMRDDHYGWFERVDKGVFALTPKGAEGLALIGAGELP